MRLVFHPAVKPEIAAIRDWYVTQNPALLASLATAFDAAFERIRRHPLMYVGIAEFRRVQLARFPCHIYYTLHGDDLWIIGIAHAHASPEKTMAEITSRLS